MSNYYEARQHLNLSQYAFDVVEFDKHEFLETPSLAKILNMIISSYMEDADAAIGTAANRYRQKLFHTLTEVPECAEKDAIVETLVNAYCSELQKKAVSYPKEHQFKIQLNEENYLTMQSWRDTGGFYRSSPSCFLKAVIEEYARKPFFQRESILLRHRIDFITSAISANQLLIITLRNGNRFELKPFCVCGDPGYNYHYLVGYTKPEGSDAEEYLASFRLSRIKDLRVSHLRSGKITQKQKVIIEQRIHRVGVQFLLQEADIIRIRMSPQGKRMYETQVHLRPAFTGREVCADGSWVYEFNCTQMQAEYYFFKFGEFAQILTPKGLAEKMKNAYSAAAAQYK